MIFELFHAKAQSIEFKNFVSSGQLREKKYEL